MDLSKGILIASANRGKIKELDKIFSDFNITSLLELNAEDFDVPETGTTFKENAFIKAKAYAERFSMVALADDSGLEVDFLNGAPGINSARYAITDAERVARILKELKGATNRGARFVCVVCMYDPKTKETLFADGFCNGNIGIEPLGTNGFGYDPIFIPDGFSNTMAELEPDVKNSISHRARALKSLKEKILHTK